MDSVRLPESAPVVLLASTSPRRKALLEQVGLYVKTFAVSVDESYSLTESPTKLVSRLACAKMKNCLENVDTPVTLPIVAADTVIDRDGVVVGKPRNRQEGIATLLSLANRTHLVHTGVCVAFNRDTVHQTRVSTEVSFGPIDETMAMAYWDTGEPVDKAGGYAIQGLGARFVCHLSGSYSNVVGLPIYETVGLLQKS